VRRQSARCAYATDGRLDIRVSTVTGWSSWLRLSGGSRCFSVLPDVGTAMWSSKPPVQCLSGLYTYR